MGARALMQMCAVGAQTHAMAVGRTEMLRPLLTHSSPIATARRPRKPCSGFHRYPNSVLRISRSGRASSPAVHACGRPSSRPWLEKKFPPAVSVPPSYPGIQ